MPRRVKDFIDISEYTSLEDLIRYLETIRDNLPAEHQAELKIRGDDIFGRRLTISYFREQTPEEVELEVEVQRRRRRRRQYRAAPPQARRRAVQARQGQEPLGPPQLAGAIDQAPALPQLILARRVPRARHAARLLVIRGFQPFGSVDLAGPVEPVEAVGQQANSPDEAKTLAPQFGSVIHLGYIPL